MLYVTYSGRLSTKQNLGPCKPCFWHRSLESLLFAADFFTKHQWSFLWLFCNNQLADLLLLLDQFGVPGSTPHCWYKSNCFLLIELGSNKTKSPQNGNTLPAVFEIKASASLCHNSYASCFDGIIMLKAHFWGQCTCIWGRFWKWEWLSIGTYWYKYERDSEIDSTCRCNIQWKVV